MQKRGRRAARGRAENARSRRAIRCRRKSHARRLNETADRIYELEEPTARKLRGHRSRQKGVANGNFHGEYRVRFIIQGVPCEVLTTRFSLELFACGEKYFE